MQVTDNQIVAVLFSIETIARGQDPAFTDSTGAERFEAIAQMAHAVRLQIRRDGASSLPEYQGQD